MGVMDGKVAIVTELYADNIAANALSPTKVVPTPGTIFHHLATEDNPNAEPPSVMAEASLPFCSGDPNTLTGRIVYSQELLVGVQSAQRGNPRSTPQVGSADVLRVVTPRTTWLLAPNSGPITFDGTNSWALHEPGHRESVIVDPGPDDPIHSPHARPPGPQRRTAGDSTPDRRADPRGEPAVGRSGDRRGQD
jgi:hypothetical protein